MGFVFQALLFYPSVYRFKVPSIESQYALFLSFYLKSV